MLKERLQHMFDWIHRMVTQPRDELTRWQITARFAYDLSRYGAHQLKNDRAPQMAGALAFRTLFGLLPVLVVGTILIRAIGGFDQLMERLADFFNALAMDKAQAAVQNGDAGASETLSDWMLGLVAQVENINLAAITWIGVAVLIYSALGLMVTIENSFNQIYRAPEGRSWLHRFPTYFTVLVLGPTVLAMSVYLNNSFNAMLTSTGFGWGLLHIVPIFWTFIVTWLVMFTVYKWVPNTHVGYRPAILGALVAAVLLELGKHFMGAYLENAFSIQHLYGSLGLIPLFMFWVYVMWLIVLFGLEVAAILQMLRGRRLEELEQRRLDQAGLIDPAMVVSVMECMANGFAAGKALTARDVAEEVRMPEASVGIILDRLEAESFLHHLDRDDRAFTLARPPDAINADRLLQIGFDLVDGGVTPRAGSMIDRLREAQIKIAAQTTLARLTNSSD